MKLPHTAPYYPPPPLSSPSWCL